ncbi:hypothetical protein [Ruminococcus flavefaciens]|uniref:hypothetical protein n=1 Tax=Ruminococcus flavefaciens TaxID=1265 RepID=UPI0002E26978|nr:hypothetical protein [Ruminococcus flavefaciens]
MKKKKGNLLVITGIVFLIAGAYINYWRFRWLICWIGYVTDPEPKIGIIGGGMDPVQRFFLDMNILEIAGMVMIAVAPALIVMGAVIICSRQRPK